jgi:hypothetical protein
VHANNAFEAREKNWSERKLYNIFGASLHHYTDYLSLDSIIRNKQLWLSNVRQSNDRAEMTNLFELLQASVEKVFKNDTSIDHEKIKSFFDSQRKLLSEEVDNACAYAFCLTREEDEASQWDRYANNGTGVCLTFNAKLLYCILPNNITHDSVPGIVMQQVYYNENADNHKLVEVICSAMKGKFTNGFKSIDDVGYNSRASAVAYKHKSFRNEKEVRLVSFAGVNKDNPKNYIIKPALVKEALTLDMNRKEDLNLNFYDLIEKITIGPKSKQSSAVLSRWLDKIKEPALANKIFRSKCTLD